MTVTAGWYMALAAVLFVIGAAGLLLRRNALVMFMSVELMLNAANLALVAFSYFNKNLDRQVVVMLVVTIAAAEVAVGLALIVSLARKKLPVWINDLNKLKY